MRKVGWLIVLSIVSSTVAAIGSGLPPEVTDRLEHAISFDGSNDFVGTYRITISSLVQKPNGKSRDESRIEADVVKSGEGDTRRRLLSYMENGDDVTEKKRAKFESEKGGRKDDDDDDLADPFGDAADRYSFGRTESRGAIEVVAFEPAPGHEGDKDISRGAIAWNAESLEPQWLEMEAVHPPKPLKELRMKMEFSVVGENLYLSKLVTDGQAKILLLKREFHMEIFFDDIRPATKDVD